MRIATKDISSVLKRFTQNVEALSQKFEKANLEIKRNTQMLEFLDAYSRGIDLYSKNASRDFQDYVARNFVRSDNPINDIISYFETVRAFMNEKTIASYFYKNDYEKFCATFVELYRINNEASTILKECFSDNRVDFKNNIIPKYVKEKMIEYAYMHVLNFATVYPAKQNQLITEDEFSNALSAFLDKQHVSPGVIKFDDSETSGFIAFVVDYLKIRNNDYERAVEEASDEISKEIERAYSALIKEVGAKTLQASNKISRFEDRISLDDSKKGEATGPTILFQTGGVN